MQTIQFGEQGTGESQILLPSSPMVSQDQDLTPLNIIRTETVLSKLPVHNLTKKGSINIRIVRRNPQGEIELLWKVSPSRDYGEPRQLAYKLDTIVINQRLDQEGRPLPELIRLGTLREIARELALGGDTATVKKALHQNAGAYITAKLNYKGIDGVQRHLEAGFTRFTIIFTGEVLPNGHKADAVYIELHPRYREVVNNAPVRPLNYNYLKELAPAPQRFYEIISYRIFAALKFHLPEAKLLYSDYCTFSAQQRYFDYDHFKKQMYKVHRPHLRSDYLRAVRYMQTTDIDGKPDWDMHYTPGPQARAEYTAFTRKPLAAQTVLDAEEPEEAQERGIAVPPPAPAQPPGQPQLGPPVDPQLLTELTRRGIIDRQARKLLHNLAPDQEVMDQLEYGDQVISQAPPRVFRNPPGFYVSLIKDRVIPPESFENSRRRALREKRERARQQWLFEEQQLWFDYDRYREQEKDRYITGHLTHERYERLLQAKKRHFGRQYPLLPDQTLTDMAHGAIRGEIESQVSFLSFEDWKTQRSAGSGATSPSPPPPRAEEGPPAPPVGQGIGQSQDPTEQAQQAPPCAG